MDADLATATDREGTGSGPPLWVECPRDAWQALPKQIPAALKREHLQELLDVGLRHLDLGSFVSPKAVPQMADTEEVLDGLERPDDADFLCIIANRRGLDRARTCGNVTSVGYPLSINETFQRRNSGMGVEESWRLVEELAAESREDGPQLVVYLSMALGNPYGEPWRPEEIRVAIERLGDIGVTRIALADTAGTADAMRLERALELCPEPSKIGLHLHARPDRWPDLLEVSWEAGVRWFEGALGGAGGCPFASDELVGNLASEQVLPWIAARDPRLAPRLKELPELARRAVALQSSHRF